MLLNRPVSLEPWPDRPENKFFYTLKSLSCEHNHEIKLEFDKGTFLNRNKPNSKFKAESI